MPGYRETFAGNVDYAYGRGTRDIASHLDRAVSSAQGAGGGISALSKQASATRGKIKDLTGELANLRKEQDSLGKEDLAGWVRLQGKIDGSTKSIQALRKEMRQMPFDAMEKGLAKITKGLISFNSSLLSLSFEFLIDSIKRVYDLQEKWTKAIGGFNMRIGGMSSGLKGATKAAVQWSSTIRGLTNGDINEGIQMFGDFSDAIGSTIDKGVKFQKFGIEMARGFNLGGAGAGQLTKVLSDIGDNLDDMTDVGGTIIKSANAAHESTNALAKDILDSSTYMARFGKEGQKTFVEGAAYVRKYNINMEQLKSSMEGMDMFDEAAKTASKLNTAFGTMINSMDLMMEDDPAKRLETIRQQFLAQGTTYDKLTPKQRRYLSETLKLTEDQTAALLDVKNANQSYADFQAKAQKKEKDELSAKKAMEKQLQKTSQTMYAFGAAFDRITVAIANAIQPLLKVLGLATDGDKKFTGFGQVMESITKTVEEFFNSLAKNREWKDFMGELGHDLQRAGSALRDFVMSGGAARLVGDIAKGMQSFYVTVRDLAIKAVPMFRPVLDLIMALSQHIGVLAAAWGGMKAFNMAGGINGLPGKLLGKGVGALGTKVGGRIGMAGAAAGIGGAIGGTSAGIGAGLGSLVGGAFGPIGMVLGPIVGGLAGKAIDWIFGSTKVKTELERAHEDLEEQIKRETEVREGFSAVLNVASKRQESEDRIRKAHNDVLSAMEASARKRKGQELELSADMVEALKSRTDELTLFGDSAKSNRELLDKLGVGTKLTAKQLGDLLKGASLYEDELGKLRDTTKEQADLETAKLQVSRLGQQKEAGEALKALHDQQLKSMKAELSQGGGSALNKFQQQGFLGREVNTFATAEEALAQLKKLPQNQQDLLKKEISQLELEAKINRLDMDNSKAQAGLLKTQSDFARQQTIILLRQSVQGTQEFLNFKNSSGEAGRGPEQVFRDYLSQRQGDLTDAYGIEGLGLLNEGVNFGGIASATKAEPLPMNSVFNRPSMTNYAAEGRPSLMSQPPVVVQSTIVSVIDGKEVGRSMVVQQGLMQSLTQGPR